MKRALVLVLLCGCQTYGAFSQPTTLPAGKLRLGGVVNADTFRLSDERFTTPDLGFALGAGISDRTEFDALVTGSELDLRIKHALVAPGTFALAFITGLGVSTAYSAHSSAAYLPLQVVAGVQPVSGVVFFAGPEAQGELGLDPPNQGGGFNRGQWGLLVGGVGGVALEDPAFTFCPQITVLTPVATGATGTVVQASLGFGFQVR